MDFTGSHGHGRLAQLLHPKGAPKDKAKDMDLALMCDAGFPTRSVSWCTARCSAGSPSTGRKILS